MSQPVAWAMALGILAIAVKGHFLISVDLGMAQGMEAIRMPGLDVAMKAITFFGNPLWVLGVMAVMSLWWLRPSPGTPARLASLAKPNEAAGVGEGSAGSREATGRRRSLLAIFWGAWLLGFTIQVLLRFWVAQWRPDTVAVPAAADFMTRYELAGFTSGHTFRSAFLFGWWAEWFTRRQASWATWARRGCVAMIVLVGFTRIYLNRHWFTDVVGAWILTVLVLAVARGLRRRALEEPRRG